jgi:mevalonate kinase
MAPALSKHTTFQASAPGSLMIMGEYAVLHDYPAIVAAIDRRITVTLRPRDDDRIILTSALGRFTSTWQALDIQAPFTYLLTALQTAPLTQGCDIDVKATFASTLGLGSSAAVTVATLAALDQWQGKPLKKPDLLQRATAIIQRVQGGGSGADAAASVYGGVITYHATTHRVCPLADTLPLVVIYSGEKTTTTDAIAALKKKQTQDPDRYNAYYQHIHTHTERAITAMTEKNWAALGHAFTDTHAILKTLGVSTPNIERIISALKKQPSIHGAKLSGAGLGDCVIALGTLHHPLPLHHTATVLDIHLAAKGVTHA